MAMSGIDNELRASYIAAIQSAMKEENADIREALLVSLQMSAQGDQEMEQIFVQVTSPAEATAHVHIAEQSAFRSHTADALFLAEFIERFAEAVKSQARALSNNQRRSSRLLVTAIQPGSLDVVFELPAQLDKSDKQDETLQGMRIVESADLSALNDVVSIWTVASGGDGEQVKAELGKMPIGVKRALKGIAETADKANWDIYGDVSTFTGGKKKIRLSNKGAILLGGTLKSEPEPVEHEVITGFIDGYRRSDRMLYIRKSIKSRNSLAIKVTEESLIQTVSTYAVDGQTKFRLSVSKEEKTNDMGDVLSTKRTLQQIHPQPENELVQGAVDI